MRCWQSWLQLLCLNSDLDQSVSRSDPLGCSPAIRQRLARFPMKSDLISKYSVPVPRYASYPTAAQFQADVGASQYRQWLGVLPGAVSLSLYVHIPYCRQLCWYCGCNTKATGRYEPVAGYLQSLGLEIDQVAELLPSSHTVTHIHWGGGSPNILKAEDIARLASQLGQRFEIAGAEFAVEIDPRHLDVGQVGAFARAGLNRVSIGVQDFDEAVQRAIGRLQSFAATRQAIDRFRDEGIGAVNIDLVYGLPQQTCDSLNRTLDKVVELAPERIAAFGYAHLPQRLRHQRLIPADALPGPSERFAQAALLARRLSEAGYGRIGLDHFAKPSDPLAIRQVHRNFQGYTTDDAQTLIGLGASAIGRLPQGYVQNAVSASDYAARVHATGLATVRGFALDPEDRARAHVIERLMCDSEISVAVLKQKFGKAAGALVAEISKLLDDDADGLLASTGDGFRITPLGRPFVRSICARFDSYLAAGNAKHASGV
jgi:oxygen-independent coproporphyrinogen III oxidase